MKFRLESVGTGVAALALLMGCQPASAGGGRPADDLQSRWWTWAASEPMETNPVADEDGRSCARNQPDDLWFLAGTFGSQVSRACTVPNGRRIAFPVVNQYSDEAGCALFMGEAGGSVVLDGKEVRPEAHSGPITVVGAPDNAVTGSATDSAATGCGLWVELPPLEPGTHSLRIRGQAGSFVVGVDYTLTVRHGRSGPPAR